MKGRVLVVDDDTALAEMIGIVLRGEGFEPVVLRRRRRGARRLPRSRSPTSCCSTSCCPGMDGIEVCRADPRRVRRARSSCSPPRATPSTSCSGLESGADDYIVKPFKPKELVARVRTRLRRTRRAAPERLHDRRPHDRRRRPRGRAAATSRINLTPLEFDLLVALARKPQQVFTREMLLEQVWGYRHAADTRLVNVHVQRLRAKVEHDPDNPQIVMTVRGVGYKAGAA